MENIEGSTISNTSDITTKAGIVGEETSLDDYVGALVSLEEFPVKIIARATHADYLPSLDAEYNYTFADTTGDYNFYYEGQYTHIRASQMVQVLLMGHMTPQKQVA